MDRIPRTVQSPEGPRYEGRLLVRPDDEVVDQGAGFDVATILSRRGALAVLGAGLVTAGLAACASPAPAATPTAATSTGEIPDETAGPYPGDGSNGPDVLEESGVVRSDIRSSIGGGATATGAPMTLELTILDMQNGDAPFAGVAVYVWHCDAQGGYSMYSSGIEGETYLRGVQVADAEGRVTFTSIFPACYSGRWPHIHFEVYPDLDGISDSGNAIATSQVALTESVCRTVYALSGYEGSSQNLSQVTLTSDNVFGDDGGTSQLATITGDATKGYRVALTARVDTATAPTGGSVPSGGMPGGGPGGSGGSGGQGGTPPGRP
jgi:protocatechuate 3,4-dioxygenase beta subunit